jgi:hypothetical protein
MHARLNADYNLALTLSKEHALPRWTQYVDINSKQFSIIEEKVN